MDEDAFESVAGFEGDEDPADPTRSQTEPLGEVAGDAGGGDEQNGEGGDCESVQGSLLC